MPLSDAQKKRRAYWDSLLPKEKPKAFSWNKQEKKEAPQPDATPGITLLQAAFRGRVERLKYAQYRRLRHHAANGVQVLAYIRSCRAARFARGAAAKVIQRRFKTWIIYQRFTRQKRATRSIQKFWARVLTERRLRKRAQKSQQWTKKKAKATVQPQQPRSRNITKTINGKVYRRVGGGWVKAEPPSSEQDSIDNGSQQEASSGATASARRKGSRSATAPTPRTAFR